MSCGDNVFKEMSSKDTDEAYFYDAKLLMDDQNYLNAIEKIESTSDQFRTKTRVRKRYASALAGYCSLEFITFLSTLTEANPSNLFTFVMSAFQQKITRSSYCTLSETQVNAVITAEPNNTNHKLFLTLLSLVKMGALLHENADTDGENNLGDGSTDDTFSVCDSSSFSDEQLNEFITGFSNFLTYSSTLSDSGADNITPDEIVNNCTIDTSTFEGLPEEYHVIISPCGKADSTLITDEDRYLFRALLDSLSIGIGSCDDSGNFGIAECCPALRLTVLGF